MARRCEICGKGTVYGNKISHSHRKTRRTWKANIVSILAIRGKSIKRIKLCTRCLRSEKAIKAQKHT